MIRIEALCNTFDAHLGHVFPDGLAPSGYSGGKIINPTYREVCNGTTGHAEVIQVTYDPSIISYEDLLRIHLSTHNPTTLNQQGADKGTQYRSIIFTQGEAEEKAAKKVLDEMNACWDGKIVTEIKPFEVFYVAETDHQDYNRNNSEQGYCRVVLEPKLQKFRDLFNAKVKQI